MSATTTPSLTAISCSSPSQTHTVTPQWRTRMARVQYIAGKISRTIPKEACVRWRTPAKYVPNVTQKLRHARPAPTDAADAANNSSLQANHRGTSTGNVRRGYSCVTHAGGMVISCAGNAHGEKQRHAAHAPPSSPICRAAKDITAVGSAGVNTRCIQSINATTTSNDLTCQCCATPARKRATPHTTRSHIDAGTAK